MKSNLEIRKWLIPLSWIYEVGVKIRNKLFDLKWLKSKSYPIPIICVGNLAVGGTGKTPHTEYLIQLLQKSGYNVATLSRGYKRKSKGFILADENSSSKDIGDEPYQMLKKFPNLRVAVDEDRCEGVERLMKLTNPQVDVILLDDAYQHRYISAGINILLTDFYRRFTDDILLPAGNLREPIEGKERAHIVITTKCPTNLKPIDYNIITKQLQLYPYQQLHFTTLAYGQLVPLKPEGNRIPLNVLTEENHLLLVTGIANSALIANKLKTFTSHVIEECYPDHHDFMGSDIKHLKEVFRKLPPNRSLIITTEKDAARFISNKHVDDELKNNIYILPITVRFLLNQQEKFNKTILDYVRENSRNSSVPQRKNEFYS